MATCDLGYEHGEPVAEPEPVIVAPDPGPNENDVKIAEIEAEASIKREELYTEQTALELQAEVARLRGELGGMRETLDRLAPPEPDPAETPAPVIVQTETAPGDTEEAAPVPETQTTVPAGNRSGGGWWAGYR